MTTGSRSRVRPAVVATEPSTEFSSGYDGRGDVAAAYRIESIGDGRVSDEFGVGPAGNVPQGGFAERSAGPR